MLIKHLKWKGAATLGLLAGMYALWAFAMKPTGASLGQVLTWGGVGAAISLAAWATVCIAQGVRADRKAGR